MGVPSLPPAQSWGDARPPASELKGEGSESPKVGISSPTCYADSCIFCSCQRMSCGHRSSIKLQRKSEKPSV